MNPGTAFVCVHEHAGWSLTFARGGVECVASANDAARFRPDRPLTSHWTGRSKRRPVRRPDLAEVTDLSQYLKSTP